LTATTARPSIAPRPLLVAGTPREAIDQQVVVYPHDGSEIGSVWLATEEIVEQALAAAAAAESEVAALPPYRRAEILKRAAAIVAERGPELARQMTLESGLAIRDARAEVERTVEIFEIAGEEARNIAATGEIVPIDAVERGRGRIGMTKRFPVGTVLGITAYNAPLLLVAHKLAPALAAGCPCIVKPAPKTPLSALSVGEIVLEAGAPPAALSVLPATNELAEIMVRDPRVKMLSFTGSAPVGWHLRDIAATSRVTLELGGNGAVIVHSDADLDYAAARCAMGGFLRGGQACISVQRLYVHESVFDAFREKFVECVSELRTGDPLDEATALGGLVNEAAAERTMTLIEGAIAAGGTVLHGGDRRGAVVEPTVLSGVADSERVCAEEAFSPIVVLLPYGDLDDVLERVNDSPYGLQAGLFSRDVRVIYQAFERLEVGAVIVNDVNSFRVDQMPYGGAKQSGLGREGIRYAIREMTAERLLVLDPR
jgi:acyl-CoA reductase-like NAD-dependent aldehyde dehydrogenase